MLALFFPELRRQNRTIHTWSPPARTQRPRYWLHTASAGELESLWTVALKLAEQPCELILTAFSPSALRQLERLKTELNSASSTQAQVLYVGFSPLEGQWKKTLKKAQITQFLTVKYEAWPELWSSLQRLQIPLTILGALPRRSLRVAKVLTAVLNGSLPELHLLSSRQKDVDSLQKLFPQARVQHTGDPRWDRMFARLLTGNARAQALIKAFGATPRPWGALAQVWKEDMEIWCPQIFTDAQDHWSTLWVVPHKIDAKHVAEIEKHLKNSGLATYRSSQFPNTNIPHNTRCIIVDEMGFLAELYTALDWVYVGGGFGQGVHSTLEPALQCLPIAAGPARAKSFPEVLDLLDIGMLSLIHSTEDAIHWIKNRSIATLQLRSDWKDAITKQLHATDRVAKYVQLRNS